MRIQLLGDVQVAYDGRQVDLGGQRQRCVLAVLLLEQGRAIQADTIVARAWPSDPPDTATDLVTSYVSRLRRALRDASAPVELVNRRPGYAALADPDTIDAHLFNRLLIQARRDRDVLDLEQAAQRLHEALELWHGAALADVTSPWLDAQRSRLEQMRLDAVEDLADIELRANRADTVVADLRELSRTHPHRERLTVLTIRALEAVGEPGQAAGLASRAIRSLRERGLDPSPALQEAQLDVLRAGSRPQPTRSSPGRMQLPLDTPAFTGRINELAELVGLADEGRISETVVTCSIDGMPGIGKTALAVRAAHLLAERFPDGQLFINLHGFTPETTPTKPEIALDRLLRGLGVPPPQIPLEADERAAVYRERLAGTRTLIVLDNAASEAQVRPLLPGAPGCLVLITSRRRLAALDDTHPLSLSALRDEEAAALFVTAAGTGRLSVSDSALEETIALCANVPLTLRIAAARLRNRPNWPLRHLVERLRDQTRRLAQLDDGDRSLAAALNVSYDQLTAEEQRLLRYLSLHLGTDIDVYAAAALIDTNTSTAELLLEGLVDHNLLSQPTTGRYQMHDLIRLYASHRVDSVAADERNAALTRLLDFYLHTARHADRLLSRSSVSHTPLATRKPVQVPLLTTEAHAMTWMEAERINLTAVVDHCNDTGHPAYVAALADAMHTALHIQGHRTLATRLQQAAFASASRLGNEHGQANALYHLSDAMLLTGQYPDSIDAANRAIEIYQHIDNRTGEANACCALGEALRLSSHFTDAVDALERALRLYADLGDWLGEAYACTSLGGIQKLAGQYVEAEANLEAAFRLSTQFGHRYGQAAALADLGEVQGMTGQYTRSIESLNQALGLFRELGNRLGEASVLTSLGEVRGVLKQHAKAERVLLHALELHRDLDNVLGQAKTLACLGVVQNVNGRMAESLEALEEACRLYSVIGNLLGLSGALFALADTQRDMGLHREASANRSQALSVLHHIENDL